jgi:hypothetical protein
LKILAWLNPRSPEEWAAGVGWLGGELAMRIASLARSLHQMRMILNKEALIFA